MPRKPMSGIEQQLARIAGEEVTPRTPMSAEEEWLELIYEQGGTGGGITPEQVQAMIDASIAEAAIFTTGTINQLIADGTFTITGDTMDYSDIVAAGATPVMLDEYMFDYASGESTFNAIGVKKQGGGGFPLIEICPVTTSTVTTGLGDVTAYTITTTYMTYTSYTDLDDTKVVSFTRTDSNVTSISFYTQVDYATTTYTLKDVEAIDPTQDPQLTTKEYVDAAIDAKFGEIVNASY